MRPPGMKPRMECWPRRCRESDPFPTGVVWIALERYDSEIRYVAWPDGGPWEGIISHACDTEGGAINALVYLWNALDGHGAIREIARSHLALEAWPT